MFDAQAHPGLSLRSDLNPAMEVAERILDTSTRLKTRQHHGVPLLSWLVLRTVGVARRGRGRGPRITQHTDPSV